MTDELKLYLDDLYYKDREQEYLVFCAGMSSEALGKIDEYSDEEDVKREMSVAMEYMGIVTYILQLQGGLLDD